jgi:hypothetical protein
MRKELVVLVFELLSLLLFAAAIPVFFLGMEGCSVLLAVSGCYVLMCAVFVMVYTEGWK